MEAINNWFKNSQDYYTGVAIYANLPDKDTRILKRLAKRNNRSNMAVLVSVLRKANKPKVIHTKPKKVVAKQTEPITQEVINKEVAKDYLIDKRTKQESKKIMLAELPAQLRMRYSKAFNLFIEMQELKFALNDLPASAENDALQIMLQIDVLDQERDLIWKELNHWKQHKTLLPVEADKFSKLSGAELYKKQRNIESSISKISKRVDNLYNELDKETNKTQQRKIESKINTSEKTLHQHRLNLIKIKELI